MLVTTNGRFVHLLNAEETNTVCGAIPHYYTVGAINPWNGTTWIGGALASVPDEKARNMYACKRCLKKGMKIAPTYWSVGINHDAIQAIVDAAVALRGSVADRENRKVYSEDSFYAKVDAILDAVDALNES